MRRIILLALVGVLIFFGYLCFVEGVENSDFNIDIAEFKKVDSESTKMTKELSAYNEKNDKKFEATKNNLSVAIKKYENKKNEYLDLVETLGLDEQEKEEVIEMTNKAYQIDFLLAIIGNYARNEVDSRLDLDLDLVFVESTTATAPSNAGYIFADLKFSVKGQYLEIANFIYDLEDDDRLAFEIRDFNMVSGNATFTVYKVPIESSTLSSITSTVPTTNTTTNATTNNTTNATTNNTTNSTTTNSTGGTVNVFMNTTKLQGTVSNITNTIN